jgi:hypothetical protein
MKKRSGILPARLVSAVLTVLAAALVPGCAYDPYDPGPYARPEVRYRSPYYYDYHYYPSAGVYFHVYSGRYYYRLHNAWVQARVLPSHIYIGPRERIHLRIWSDYPYRHYDLHHRRYLPHPAYRHDRDRNRFERRYNRSQHDHYLRRYRR